MTDPTTYLPCVEIEPTQTATASVIWLHGLGANGHDFEPIVPELKLPSDLAIRFVFPHAPAIPVTINSGYVMPAWYDILEMNIERKVDEAQLRISASEVVKLIEREMQRGIPSERIIIAGFSQGGAVAYEAALSYAKPLAGLLCLSTYLATKDSLLRDKANQDIPIQIFHGSLDPVVPVSLGEHAYEALKGWGYVVEYKTYPMEHSICLEEIEGISKWLQKTLGSPN